MTIRKEHLVRRIAKDLYLREDVVEEVLDRFLDVAISEIVNKGEFRIHRLLSVTTVHYKGFTAGKGEVPAHDRLKIKLSDGVNKLFRLKNSPKAIEVTPDNWRDLLSEPNEKITAKNDHLYNPLLDED